MKTAEQRARTVARDWDMTTETRDHLEEEFRKLEAEVRADERAKVLARVRMAVQICRLTIDDAQVKAILKGIEDGCDQ